MMRTPRTALGIDISDGRIHLAMLRRTVRGGFKLLKAATGTVPDGAVKDGNVEDPALLASAIKKLKAAKRMYSHNVALSLVANPTLTQILDLPQDRPSNVRSFVFDEVKHYAMLPMKYATVDFWGITVPGKADGRRVLVAATDERRVAATAGAFEKKGLRLTAVEPAWVAYIRACYAEKIAGEFDTNLLFAVVHNGTITLCLFRSGALDFVRTKRIETDSSDSRAYSKWLADEINAIVRFYEFEVSDQSGKWKVILAADDRGGVLEEQAEQLKSKLDTVELEAAALADAYARAPVVGTKKGIEASTVAVGLAMKLLNVGDCDLDINLLPAQVAKTRAMERQVLISANTAALVFLLMVLAVGFYGMKAKKVNEQITRLKHNLADNDILSLKSEQTMLDNECARISEKLGKLSAMIETTKSVKWSRMLDEVGSATPQDVQITELSSSDGSKISIQGLARSHQAINLFVDTLSECDRIESASLVRAEKDGRPDGLIKYSVNCLLIPWIR